jgi:hypothetical protein
MHQILSQKQKTGLIPAFIISIMIFFFAGCEDMFVKEIDIEQADFPAKLAITAILDTDSGRFTLSMREANSIKYYSEYRPNYQSIIRNGSVRLFEDGQEIFSETGEFDLSVGQMYDGESGYYDSYDKTGYYTSFTNIPVSAGRTYRIEIDINGYDMATATAVMPDAPSISDVFIDYEHPVTKENIAWISSLYYGYDYGNVFYPLSLNITDNSSQSDFYSLQIENNETTEYHTNRGYGEEYWTETYYSNYPLNIATSNLTLIQDNPDYESQDIALDGESTDLYAFTSMMLTDVTFADKTTKLDLYSTYFSTKPSPYDRSDIFYPRPVNNYDPERHGEQYHVIHKVDVLVRHHTQEAFKQYRSMAFQLAGIGFFSEPVFITSNMENAYGGFSVQNTLRFPLFEFEGYAYSGTVTEEDF